jgi:hypothetical protein
MTYYLRIKQLIVEDRETIRKRTLFIVIKDEPMGKRNL